MKTTKQKNTLEEQDKKAHEIETFLRTKKRQEIDSFVAWWLNYSDAHEIAYLVLEAKDNNETIDAIWQRFLDTRES